VQGQPHGGRSARLIKATLVRTNLSGAKLSEADLSEAHLEGATMPNGQKYEDWLEDKEGPREDGENSGLS
jgi:hypothetical protein